MPNMFIPFAERSSLISDIGKVVLDKVGKQLQEWKSWLCRCPSFCKYCCSTNSSRSLLSDLDEVLDTYHLDGSNLELEITESALLDNTDNVKTIALH